MSCVPELAGPIAWFAAIAYGLYVAGITVVSRSETSGGNRGGLLAGLALQDLAILGLAGVALAHRHFPQPDPDRPLIPLEGLLVLALVALAVNSSAARALSQPIPRLIQKTSRPASSPWSGCTSAWSPVCGDWNRRPWSRSSGCRPSFSAGGSIRREAT